MKMGFIDIFSLSLKNCTDHLPRLSHGVPLNPPDVLDVQDSREEDLARDLLGLN